MKLNKMESPASCSTWSDTTFQLSDDSGLLLTSGSASSGSSSGRCKLNMELLESDGEDKSLSQADSLDGMSDAGMYGEHFNTLKKGPTSAWCELAESRYTIDPPPEFQDSPSHCLIRLVPPWLDSLAVRLVTDILEEAIKICVKTTIHTSESNKTKNTGKIVKDCKELTTFCLENFSRDRITKLRKRNHDELSHNQKSLAESSQEDKSKSDCSSVELDSAKKSILKESSKNVNTIKDLDNELNELYYYTEVYQPDEKFLYNKENVSLRDNVSKNDEKHQKRHRRTIDIVSRSNFENIRIENHYDKVENDRSADFFRKTKRTEDLCKSQRTLHSFNSRLCWAQELLSYSPHHRPNSRSSLSSSRLSSSHNSLTVQGTHKADDSNFITQAVSHDVLVPVDGQISDLYNVPFDSDIYALPVDVVRPRTPPRRNKQMRYRKRRRNVSAGSQTELARHIAQARQLVGKPRAISHVIKSQAFLSEVCNSTNGKRHSVPGGSIPQPESEPIHMTLQEVRQYLQTLYSSSSDSSDKKSEPPRHESIRIINTNSTKDNSNSDNSTRKHKKNTFVISLKNKKVKDSSEASNKRLSLDSGEKKKSPVRSFTYNLKQTLCNLFKFKRMTSPEHVSTKREVVVKMKDVLVEGEYSDHLIMVNGQKVSVQKRALPPLPKAEQQEQEEEGGELSMDFASSIEKVKDYGWYWGPISGEAAEKVLSNEPDGSFIVRDSSDDHYIFSLTFKLNGCVRHVRIEHDQGNFSFGSCTKFKSHTIVEFIQNAVEHSRSGRYLFFLHRRPVLGPMRVQLLHPVSRFKQIQSLQHMCRFVILKVVRRDLISELPLPRRMIDYLSTKQYYSEQLLESEESEDAAANTTDR